MERMKQEDLPHNHESEKKVLGTILYEAGGYNDGRFFDICIQKGLVPEAFHDKQNIEVYRAMCKLDAAHKPVDYATVAEELRAQRLLKAIGGLEYLESLMGAAPMASHIDEHLRIVFEKYKLRQQIRVYEEGIDACLHNEAVGADFLRSQSETKLLNIGSTQNAMMSWHDLVEDTAKELEDVSRRDKPVLEGLATGFTDLDAKMLGLRPGEMVIIAARPSIGKTSLAMNIAENVAMEKHPVLVFSVEMPAKALSKRMIAGRAKVNLHRLNRCLLNHNEVEEAQRNIKTARTELSDAPIFVDDTSGIEVSELFSRARRMVRQKGIELIVVDYLQLCCCCEAAKQGGPYAETTAISQNLKAMAKTLKVPVIVLSQMSRASEQRGQDDPDPKLSDLRGSGAIEQDADVVLFIKRPQKKFGSGKEKAAIDVAKNRNGATGEVTVAFERAYTRFSNS